MTSALSQRARYLRRIGASYLGRGNSQLTFWHEEPTVNPAASYESVGPYYMTFADKAAYPGPFDEQGVPLLDYHGIIGKRRNPIAIAQYGLAHYNLMATRPESRDRFLGIATYMRDALTPNDQGLAVWMHDFDWEYRDRLVAPWYSGLAQGQGISLLVRAHAETGDESFLDAARLSFDALAAPVSEGGTMFVDGDGMNWIEEYIVDPPTHILNGFLWALWGVFDLLLATGDAESKKVFETSTITLTNNLDRYDIGFWSLYELSGTRLRMIASPFYHRLHIVQLLITATMTKEPMFAEFADRWQWYAESGWNRKRALAQKAIFKLAYY